MTKRDFITRNNINKTKGDILLSKALGKPWKDLNRGMI